MLSSSVVVPGEPARKASLSAMAAILDMDIGNMLARELGLSHAEPSSSSSFYAPPAVIAAQRQQLLRELQIAVKKAIQRGMEAGETAICCDEPAVYELCLALESCLEHHLLPPITLFSQQSGLWLVLQQLQRQASASRSIASDVWSSSSDNAQWEELRAVAEGAALAHGLSERQIASSSMPLADAHTRSAYAARLWLCLALTRSKLPLWVSVAVKASAAAYGEHALVRTEEAR